MESTHLRAQRLDRRAAVHVLGTTYRIVDEPARPVFPKPWPAVHLPRRAGTAAESGHPAVACRSLVPAPRSVVHSEPLVPAMCCPRNSFPRARTPRTEGAQLQKLRLLAVSASNSWGAATPPAVWQAKAVEASRKSPPPASPGHPSVQPPLLCLSDHSRARPAQPFPAERVKRLEGESRVDPPKERASYQYGNPSQPR